MSSNIAGHAESIRLLIWDLDDTFWKGTLTEGGATIITEHVEIVKTLWSRGIASSICSKNDKMLVEAQLSKIGLLQYFVFSKMSWDGKGSMVRDIIVESRLRPESIMFIDDNEMNINEVKHYNPQVQTEQPGFLTLLLADDRFIGKSDAKLERLEHYKVLERRLIDAHKPGRSNIDFLRNSNIKVSFHQDVTAQFDRIHDLINRTNQLNFTKKRLDEDSGSALAQLELSIDESWSRASYIKVSDDYGYHGIVGFYVNKLTEKGWALEHFLFSCRCLNMGIEQFVYKTLNYPSISIVGEVVSELGASSDVDWIKVLEDAEQAPSRASGDPLKVCLRGSCDLDQLTHYLGFNYSIIGDFPFPYNGALVATPSLEFASNHLEFMNGSAEKIIDLVPFMHPRVLESPLFGEEFHVFVQSFGIERDWRYFQHVGTGIEIPMRLAVQATVSYEKLTALSFEQVGQLSCLEVTEDEWQWFQENMAYSGGFDIRRFEKSLLHFFKCLKERPVIFILGNTRHGADQVGLEANLELNEVVEKVSRPYNAKLIKIDDLIADPTEVTDANHFSRIIFLRLASELKALLNAEGVRIF